MHTRKPDTSNTWFICLFVYLFYNNNLQHNEGMTNTRFLFVAVYLRHWTKSILFCLHLFSIFLFRFFIATPRYDVQCMRRLLIRGNTKKKQKKTDWNRWRIICVNFNKPYNICWSSKILTPAHTGIMENKCTLVNVYTSHHNNRQIGESKKDRDSNWEKKRKTKKRDTSMFLCGGCRFMV